VAPVADPEPGLTNRGTWRGPECQRRAVADLTAEKQVLKDIAEGNF